jgi:PAS domain S-box-containing protein
VDEDTSTASRGSSGRRRAAQVRFEWVALGAVLLAFAALMGLDLRASRQAIEATERDRLRHQAHSAEERLGNRLEAASNGLGALAVEAPRVLAERDGVARLNERLQIMASAMTGIRTLLVVNADGIAVASNRKELIGNDFHDGERYRVIRSRLHAATVYISPPFKTPLGVWAVSVGRAILNPRGEFDGYVLAILDPAYLNGLLDSARYAPDMAAGLVHDRGKIIYRIPDPSGAAGLDLSAIPGSSFNRHVQSGQALTFWTAPLASTGRESMVAIQSIRPSASPSDGYLVAFFARETGTVLTSWRKDVRDRVAVLGVAALVSGAALFLFQRRRAATDRLEAAHEVEHRRQGDALRENATRLGLAIETSGAGMWEWNVRTGENVWSDALWDLYGLDRTRHAPSYEAWRESIVPEDRQRAEETVSRAAASGAPFEVEYRVGGRDCPVRWLLSRGRPVHGAGGEVERYLGIVIDVSESKRAAALQMEHARLGALEEAVSLLPIGVAITELGPDGEPRIVSVNAAQQRLVASKAPPGAAVSDRPFTAFQPDRVTRVEPRDGPGPTAARTGAPAPLKEFHLRLADGTWKVVLATGMPIATESGSSPRRAISLLVDITAAWDAANALRASEARYRDLVELSPNGVFVNRAGRIEFVNRAALALFGAERAEQLVGKSPFELFHPDFHRIMRERLALLQKGGTAPPVLERIVRLDGTLRDVEVTAAPFQDDRGTAFQVVLRDVTDERRKEAALRDSEQRFRAIFDGATDGIVTADPSTGQLLSCNAAFAAMTGYTVEEIRTLHFKDMHEPEDRPAVGAAFEAMAMGQIRTTDGTPVRRRDGSVFPADISAIRLTLPDRTFLAAFFRDVTERRKAEADLRALQDQLSQSQRMEGIGRLAGGVAHDFNNILSIILSCAGFALEGLKEGDPVREDVLEIEKGAKRAAALTRQLLAFSRRQVLQPVAMDLNQSLGGMEKMLRRIIGEDIDLVRSLAPDLGIVKADPGQIEQVVLNLAVNARDAMPDGGKLTIETANVDLDEEYASRHLGTKPGPHVMMAITDSGVGMDERTLSRIFEPFFTTKGPGAGTGLGLSTVYGIVKQSGGSIYVYSEVGQGTTFKIYLPRERSLEAPAPHGSLPASGAVRGETILLVEDDEAVRAVARRILVGAGYDVLVAASGAEGLLTCERHAGEIHLLLTDVVMPQMSGRVFAERASTTRPGMKVLYMSGYTDNAIVHHGVLDPGTQFIGKPLSQTELLAKVREVLDGDGT